MEVQTNISRLTEPPLSSDIELREDWFVYISYSFYCPSLSSVVVPDGCSSPVQPVTPTLVLAWEILQRSEGALLYHLTLGIQSYLVELASTNIASVFREKESDKNMIESEDI